MDLASSGFTTDSPTLAAGNIANRVSVVSGNRTVYKDSSYVVQVTSKHVSVHGYDSMLDAFSPVPNGVWTPPQRREIVAAAINSGQIFVAIRGHGIMFIRWNEQGFTEEA